jgi:Acetyltransferase (GNAT) domain
VTSSLDRGTARVRYGLGQLSAGVSAARERQAGAVRLAVDEDGRQHAGAFFVWDAERLYYLVGGSDTALRSSGGMSLVIWDGIKLAGSLGLRFDFEGSMIEPIERFFRGFGGTPEPYLHVTHTSRRLAAALSARDLLQAVAGRRPADRRAARERPSAREGAQES